MFLIIGGYKCNWFLFNNLSKSQTKSLFVLVELEKFFKTAVKNALWNTFKRNPLESSKETYENEILLLTCFSKVNFELGCRVLRYSKNLS